MVSNKRVQTQVQQGPARVPSSAGEKVVVLCKYPAGIRIRNFKMRDSIEQGPTVARDIKIAEKIGEDILINGNACEVDKRPRCLFIGDYAVSQGVDKESWDAWLHDNKDSPMVRNRVIMSFSDLSKAEDAGGEHEEVRSGFEPFLTDDDPRRPRPTNPHLTEPTREEGQAKRARMSA